MLLCYSYVTFRTFVRFYYTTISFPCQHILHSFIFYFRVTILILLIFRGFLNMQIFIRSVKLWCLGIILEAHKKYFDSLVDKYIKNNRSLSSRHLTQLSHRCSSLYEKFRDDESRLLNDILIKRLGN